MTESQPEIVDLSDDDDKIAESDNSGEPGMPEENQDPNWIPEGSAE